jgi:hypothetical protein
VDGAAKEEVMASLRTIVPELYPTAQKFVEFLEANGLKVTVTSARRDGDNQAALYACFLKVGCSDCGKRPGQKGCFPAAAPGHSMHALGVAFDLHIDPNVPEAYAAAGRVWESIGGTWGGHFNDPIHFDARKMLGAA